MTAEPEHWKPAPAAPRFEIHYGADTRLPGGPNRPLLPKGTGFALTYRFEIPEGNSDAVNERRPMSWQFIAIPQRRSYDLQEVEATLRRVISDPDADTVVLAYTEGDFTILLFSPKAVSLAWILLQAKGARECERPNPGYADRLVIGSAETWGNMVRPPPKR